ncbi:hypothetical protein B398_02225 [Xylella fastidiosa 32]|nr:hypothetical protein B398_02225 [Xylella fastidiosa 32]
MFVAVINHLAIAVIRLADLAAVLIWPTPSVGGVV